MQPSRKHCTLLLLRAPHPITGEDSLLLGNKLRGFGMGKLNGFGGKVDPGEPLLAAALREMQEESGLTLPPPSARHVGHLVFTFEGRPAEELHVHVFAGAPPFSGVAAASEEMEPSWWPASAPPVHRMWADDAHWLPLLLAGKRFAGRFHFEGHQAIKRFELRELGEGEAVCEEVGDPATTVLVPAGAAPQSAIDF